MEATKIKRFFVFFTLVYFYIAVLQFWGLTYNWNITSNPLTWPESIFNLLLSVEFFYDLLAIGILVQVHHR